MRRKALTDREERILLLLKSFDYLSRDQLQTYFKLGTIRNTNRVLSDLSDYLDSFRDGYQSVYYLNKNGREYVESNKVRKKSSQVDHYLMRNEFWLYCNCPKDWKNEVKISTGKVSIVADAMYSIGGLQHFLEVDHKQTMKENRAKIERYKGLMNSIALKVGHFPVIVWVTTTELRRKQLEEACRELPQFKVFLINDIR
ncbi:MAG TPA: replication-relaxation family protein [Ureibacillus sp.]|nr:replication-relaxation family protein [Ureibacillus sp.]